MVYRILVDVVILSGEIVEEHYSDIYNPSSGFNFIIVWKRLFGGSGKLREFHFAKFLSTLPCV